MALFFSWASIAAAGEKTDILVMSNGDSITGDIKGLQQGKLRFGTNDLGTLSVTWEQVASLVSKKTVEVETIDGALHYGVLEAPTHDGNLALGSDGDIVEVPIERVVRISLITRSFWQGLNGSFSVGGSFTKSSDVLQVSLSADVGRRTRNSLSRLGLNAISTDQADGHTQNINSMLSYTRLLQKRWLAGGLAAYERNQSVGIENRILIGAAGGRQLVETNRQFFVMLAGLDANFEQTTALEDGAQESLEAFLSVLYSRFRFDHPKQNFSTSFMAFPSLTQSGRFRAQLNSDWRQEIVSDLFFEISIYATYDNQPPQGALATTDYGIVTSLGYSFSP